jgi:hypothetical protein
MTEDDDIQNKIWNIELVVEDIKKFPQTYGTILKHKTGNYTYQVILSRKMNKLCSDGTVYKSMIPGTRFSRMIYYCLPKTYTIIVESTRTGVEVFVFYDFEKHDDFLIKVTKYWRLQDKYWEEYNKEKIFLSGHILKWI